MRRQIPFRLIAIEGIRSVPDSLLTCFQNSTGENRQFPCGGGFADVVLNVNFRSNEFYISFHIYSLWIYFFDIYERNVYRSGK